MWPIILFMKYFEIYSIYLILPLWCFVIFCISVFKFYCVGQYSKILYVMLEFSCMHGLRHSHCTWCYHVKFYYKSLTYIVKNGLYYGSFIVINNVLSSLSLLSRTIYIVLWPQQQLQGSAVAMLLSVRKCCFFH